MKNFMIFALGLALVLALTDAKPLMRFINEKFRYGTLAGVVECVRLTSSEVMSHEATKKACSNKFDVRVASYKLNGRGGPTKDKVSVSLGASLTNGYSDVVFTFVELELLVKDDSGKTSSFLAKEKVWIEPDAVHRFDGVLKDLEPDEFLVEKHCGDVENEKNCWTWGVKSARGVFIK